MKKSHSISKLVHIVAALLTPNVWAVGIAQSTDRPSLQQPSRPDFLSEKQGFTLVSDFYSPLHEIATPDGQACMYEYICDKS